MMLAADQRLLATRLQSQLLSGEPAADPLIACRRLLAVQAQDPRGFRLAIRARTISRTVAALERELSEHRSLVVSWCNRGTLHLVASEDYPWLHALTTPPLATASARRLAQEGLPPNSVERAVGLIERWLAADGPLTRPQLRARLNAVGIPTAGQALVHILFAAALRGVIVRGPLLGREHAYVLVADWLGAPPPVDREQALAELARRYLAGHGPADERDLARWAGLPLREARAGLRAIASEIVDWGMGLLVLASSRRASAPELPPPRLLGAFEPVLLGWGSREFVTGVHQVVLVRNGIFRPFALARGRAVARWRLDGARAEIEPLEQLATEELAALERDGRRVQRYLD